MTRPILFLIAAMLTAQVAAAQSPDSLITEILEASVITEGNVTYKIDRTTHFFTAEQMKTAREARDLTATIPGLFIDEQDNALKTVGGKRVLILINGVRAKDTDLQLIPAGKVKKVDYYNVPPVKYMDEAEVMINVHTARLDTGWSGAFYARGGQMYSNANASIGYVSGNNMITLDIGTHFNQKRKVWDTETGLYSCNLGGDAYNYNYLQTSQSWGRQLRGGLTWLNSKDDNYVLQASLSMSENKDKTQRDRNIELKRGSLSQERKGYIRDNTDYLSPTAELYFSKTLSQTSTLTFDLIGTMFSNEQTALSTEEVVGGSGGYTDRLKLDSRKRSFTGEVGYDWSKGNHALSFGYKGTGQWLDNKQDGGAETNVTTSTHRLYGEYSSRVSGFSYRISLGATGNVKSGGSESYTKIDFTPTVLLGYSVNSKNYLRLMLSSATEMPNIQQMSENRIMIMEGFYRSGNQALKSSVRYGTQLLYLLQPNDKFYMTADAHYNYTSRQMYSRYVDEGTYWNLQTANAHHYSETGSNVVISYSPWEFLNLEVDASAEYQGFKETAAFEAYHHWYFPVYANLTLSHKGFTLMYRHSFGKNFINGLYLEGLEKISYINLSYRFKNLSVGLQCLFPFVNDKFERKTSPLSPVMHNTSTNLKTKNHEFGLTLSWNFIKGKSKYADKTMDNEDYDSGKFEY